MEQERPSGTDPQRSWETVKEYQEILFDRSGAIGRITINRPRVHNAFTPPSPSPR